MADFKAISFSKDTSNAHNWVAFPLNYTVINGSPSPATSYVTLVKNIDNSYFLANGNFSSCSSINTISYDKVNYLSSEGFIDLGDFILDSTHGYYLFFPVSVFYTPSVDYGVQGSVDSRHPVIVDSLGGSPSSYCSSVVNTNITISYNTLYTLSSVVVDDSGGSSDSSPDYTLPILMIPATLVCLSFMFVIFKMFINRRLRS